MSGISNHPEALFSLASLAILAARRMEEEGLTSNVGNSASVNNAQPDADLRILTERVQSMQKKRDELHLLLSLMKGERDAKKLAETSHIPFEDVLRRMHIFRFVQTQNPLTAVEQYLRSLEQTSRRPPQITVRRVPPAERSARSRPATFGELQNMRVAQLNAPTPPSIRLTSNVGNGASVNNAQPSAGLRAPAERAQSISERMRSIKDRLSAAQEREKCEALTMLTLLMNGDAEALAEMSHIDLSEAIRKIELFQFTAQNPTLPINRFTASHRSVTPMEGPDRGAVRAVAPTSLQKVIDEVHSLCHAAHKAGDKANDLYVCAWILAKSYCSQLKQACERSLPGASEAIAYAACAQREGVLCALFRALEKTVAGLELHAGDQAPDASSEELHLWTAAYDAVRILSDAIQKVLFFAWPKLIVERETLLGRQDMIDRLREMEARLAERLGPEYAVDWKVQKEQILQRIQDLKSDVSATASQEDETLRNLEIAGLLMRHDVFAKELFGRRVRQEAYADPQTDVTREEIRSAGGVRAYLNRIQEDYGIKKRDFL